MGREIEFFEEFGGHGDGGCALDLCHCFLSRCLSVGEVFVRAGFGAAGVFGGRVGGGGHCGSDEAVCVGRGRRLKDGSGLRSEVKPLDTWR